MMMLVIGLVMFFAVHLVSTNTGLRDGLIARFGARGYRVAYSIASLIGFAVIVIGFHKMQMPQYLGSKNPILWYPPEWTRYVASALMLPAMILLVASLVPSKIRAWVGHPMMAAVKFWGLAHLISNGTAAAMLLFASFIAYAVYARISLKWRGIAARPHEVPSGLMGDGIVLLLGVAFYVAMVLWGHEYLIGKPLGI